MLAQLTGAREFRLDADRVPPGPGQEAKLYADAITGLAEFHQIPLSPKRIAELNFATTLMRIYSPRIMAYRMRRRREKGASGPIDGPATHTGAFTPKPTQRQAEPIPIFGPAPPPPVPTAPPGFSMPTPANQPDVNNTYLNIPPSALWAEPAADRGVR